MSEYKNFEGFVDGLKESDFLLDKELKDRILTKAANKINSESSTENYVIKSKKRKTGYLNIRNIAAAGLLLLFISAVIPNSPVNALYQRIFSFIPGVGVVQNGSEEELIKGAVNEPVRVADNDEFLEVASAYITGNTLNVTIITNIGTSTIEDIMDKEEVLKYFSGETMPGIFLQYNGYKEKISSYSAGGLSSETKAYTVKGLFYLYENTLADNLFSITMEGFEKPVEFKLSPVKNGVTPEAMGSTITVNDMMIFANTKRSDGILSVDLSTVAGKKYQGIRFYLFEHEKALFHDSVYIVDGDGVKYYPDEDLRKQGNSGIDTFYFRVPDDKAGVTIVLPQILYSTKHTAGIKANMPENSRAVSINREIEFEDSTIQIDSVSLISAGDSLLPRDFKEFSCLRVDYGTRYRDNTNIRILRIIPDIQVPDSLTGYRAPSSAVYSDLLRLDDHEGYALVHFEDMDKTKRIMMKLDIEMASIGPFVIELN